ncbi:MAG: diguanylate cyclase [Candidatus Shapirobacteria bacterium]|nr:diguanylate cyclase [Candidatus Shapirobacteria bacterium]
MKTDKLTGLPSSFALEELIENFNPQDYPTDTQIFCVFIDLKGLKAINDSPNGGHDAGDLYIQLCAKKLASSFRLRDGQDILVRQQEEEATGLHRQHFDGDEFVALLTCPQLNSNQLLETINQRLLDVSLTNPNILFRFGISSSPLPQQGEENKTYFKNLLDKADKNLNLKRDSETNPNSR